MSKSNSPTNQSVGTTNTSTDYRPNYLVLGVDQRGAQHVWDRSSDTVHIVHQNGGRGRRRLDGGTIDEYCDAVADTHGWQTRRLFESFGDSFERVSVQ